MRKRRVVKRFWALAAALLVPLYAAADVSTGWLWPVAPDFRCISRGYFVDDPQLGTHEAIDIPVDIGQALYAAKDGIAAVVYDGCRRSFPNGSYTSCNPLTCSPTASFYNWETGETGTENGLFHQFSCRDHKGILIASYSRCNFGYGCGVILYHPEDGVITSYAHMDSVAVQPGQAVKQGQVIGTSGARGNSFGAHLHFQIGLSPTPGAAWPTDLWKNCMPVSPSFGITAASDTNISFSNGYAYHSQGVGYVFEPQESN